MIDRAGSAHRTIPEHIASVLREAILGGALPGGRSLGQDSLAARFGVSRIPVREALRCLEAEGLVTIRPHRGAVVTPLRAAEVVDISDIRIALESLALKLAMKGLTESRIEKAVQALERLDRAADDMSGELNRDFHAALYAPCGRPRLLEMIVDIHRKFDRYMCFLVTDMSYGGRSQSEHRRLLEAWRSGDTEKAVAELERHVRTAGRKLVERLRGIKTAEREEN